MKKAVSICLIVVIGMCWRAYPAQAESKNFQVSVTIPHIPGVNSPMTEEIQRLDSAQKVTHKQMPTEKAKLTQTVKQQDMSDGEMILVRTFTEL